MNKKNLPKEQNTAESQKTANLKVTEQLKPDHLKAKKTNIIKANQSKEKTIDRHEREHTFT